jgi:hypothetical protein
LPQIGAWPDHPSRISHFCSVTNNFLLFVMIN